MQEGLAQAEYVNDLELPAFKAMPALQNMKAELQVRNCTGKYISLGIVCAKTLCVLLIHISWTHHCASLVRKTDSVQREDIGRILRRELSFLSKKEASIPGVGNFHFCWRICEPRSPPVCQKSLYRNGNIRGSGDTRRVSSVALIHVVRQVSSGTLSTRSLFRPVVCFRRGCMPILKEETSLRSAVSTVRRILQKMD